MMTPFRIPLVGHLLFLSASISAIAAEKQTFEAESAELLSGAYKVADGAASGGYLVSLSQPGQGIKFNRLPAASKLAIRYASLTNATSVKVIAPRESGAGKMEVQLDGQTRAILDLTTEGMRQPQQVVWEGAGLTPGKHAIDIINRGRGPVAVDALIVR